MMRLPGEWIRRRGFQAVFAAGLLCTLPALAAGFYSDDYVQLGKLEAGSAAAAPLDDRLLSLFTFLPGGAGTEALIADGSAPWWTSPTLRVRFFRPLSAALMLADHALFGLRPLGYHAHSLLWWGLWLAGVGLLFRRLLSPGLALLAFTLFAVDDAHWLTVGWIAARNAPVSLTFVVWGMLAHARFRDRGWRPGLPLAFGAWTAALLAGEMAVAGLMYVVAAETMRAVRSAGERPARARAVAVALFPLALLLIAYAVVYVRSGAGVHGSGAYLDPLASGGALAGELVQRYLAQVGGLLLGAPVDLWLFARYQPALVLAGVAALAMTGAWLRAAVADLPDGDAAAVGWLALGAALSLVPTSAGLLGERSLAAASIGGAAIVAVMLRHAWRRLSSPSVRLRRRAIAGVLVLGVAHLLLAPPLLIGKLLFLRANGRLDERIAASLVETARPPARAVLLWSDDLMIGSYLPAIARLGRPGALASFRTLAMAPVDLVMTRVADDQLELFCPAGALVTSPWEGLFRAPSEPLGAVTHLALLGMTVDVVEARDGRPSRVRFRFDRSLDDPSLRLLERRGDQMVPAALPGVGQSRPIDRNLSSLP